MNFDEHIDHLIDLMENVQMHKITILTGGNGRGKSLIRKRLPFVISKKMNLSPDDAHHCVKSVSMQLRTESRPEFGALSTMAHDRPWMPTSYSTFNTIKRLLELAESQNNSNNYFVFDEIEIGMSSESIAGIVKYLNEEFEKIDFNKCYGIMIITHSEKIVKTLKHDYFLNIEGMTEDEWINREIVPTDFEVLYDESIKLMQTVRDRKK